MSVNAKREWIRQQGITIVELSIAMALSVFLAGAVVTVQTTSTDRFESSLAEHRVNAVSRDAVNIIRKELRSCLYSSVVTTAYRDNDGTTIFSFQQAVSFDTANGTTIWGGGNEQNGRVEYAVLGTDLIRRIVNENGEPVEQSVMIDHVDLNPPKSGNGVPAQFQWDPDNNIVTVLINREFPINGTTVKRQVESLVYVDHVYEF